MFLQHLCRDLYKREKEVKKKGISIYKAMSVGQIILWFDELIELLHLKKKGKKIYSGTSTPFSQ